MGKVHWCFCLKHCCSHPASEGRDGVRIRQGCEFHPMYLADGHNPATKLPPPPSCTHQFSCRVVSSAGNPIYPWDFPGRNTGVNCHFLLQRFFLTQGSNPGHRHCRLSPALEANSSLLSHQGSPIYALDKLCFYLFCSS